MKLELLVLALGLLLVLAMTAVAVGRAAARGRRPWLPLTAVWLAATLPLFALNPELTVRSLGSLLVPLIPLGVTALACDMEVRRGCSLRRAGSVAVGLGFIVGVVTPFVLWSLLYLLWATIPRP